MYWDLRNELVPLIFLPSKFNVFVCLALLYWYLFYSLENGIRKISFTYLLSCFYKMHLYSDKSLCCMLFYFY